MSRVQKHRIEVVVLSRREDSNYIRNASEDERGLERIEQEISTGSCIGTVRYLGCEDVPEESLEEELLAIGNDGDFFEGVE